MDRVTVPKPCHIKGHSLLFTDSRLHFSAIDKYVIFTFYLPDCDISLNEEYRLCGSKCDNTCEERNKTCANSCYSSSLYGCNRLTCEKRCTCPYGLVRNAFGVCVQIDECPSVLSKYKGWFLLRVE